MAECFDVPFGANGEVLFECRPNDDGRGRISFSPSKRKHGIFVSRKMGTSLPWRSKLDAELMAVLEASSEVAAYEVWPEQVVFVYQGRQGTYTPSFRVTLDDGHVAVMDTVQRKEIDSERRRTLTQVLTAVYGSMSMSYRALPEEEVRLNPRLANARAILMARGYDIPPKLEKSVIRHLQQVGACQVREVEDAISHPETRWAVFAMVLDRQLRAGLGAASMAEMVISVSGH